MCEICNITKGNPEFLVSDCIPVKIGNLNLEAHELAVFIKRDENDYHSLEIEYLAGDYALGHVTIDLDFCPFCGSELKHKPKNAFGAEFK